MSDDQLDDGFKDRVKEVFDNYEDDSADEGWLLLREKYPARERRNRAIFWWRFAGTAACIALLLYFYPWRGNNIVHQVKNATAIVVKQPVEQHTIASHIKAAPGNIIHGKVQQQFYVRSNSSISAAKTKVAANQSTNAGNTHTDTADHITLKNISAVAITKANQQFVSKDSNSADNQGSVSSLNKQAEIMAGKKPDAEVSKSMLQLFEQEAKSGKNKDVQSPVNNRVVFGVYAASYVNYAKGSQRQFNNGGGLSTDIRLSDRLSINTGLLIAQNSLAYNSNTQNLPAAEAATFSRNFMPAAYNLPAVEASSANQAVNLVNLDVPINLTYKFNPQTGNTYLSAGLSSGTFINESYITTYSYSLPQSGTEQQSQDESHKSFDNFYFAQMLNVAFGLGYPLGKNHLVIEPFFKYPLGGLGDQHILFGSGGVNLKFNFGASGIGK